MTNRAAAIAADLERSIHRFTDIAFRLQDVLNGTNPPVLKKKGLPPDPDWKRKGEIRSKALAKRRIAEAEKQISRELNAGYLSDLIR